MVTWILIVAALCGVLAMAENVYTLGDAAYDEDTYLDSDQPAECFTGHAALIVGAEGEGWQPRKRRALLKFDLSDIPPNSQIVSAVLALDTHFVEGAGSRQIYIFRCPTDWGANAPGDAGWPDGQCTWDWADFENDIALFWATPGGAWVDEPRVVTAIPAAAGTWSIDLQTLVEDAIALRDGQLNILMKRRYETTTGLSFGSFRSKEKGTGTAPTLTVNYQPPAYKLTLTDDGNGSVAVDPEVGYPYYGENTRVYLTVSPDDTYEFDAWAGADAADVQGSGTVADPYYIDMDAAKTIQATFTKTTYLLTVNDGANGTTTPIFLPADGATDNGDGTWDVEPATAVYVDYEPDANYEVDDVTGLPAGSDWKATIFGWSTSTPFYMTGPVTLAISFQLMHTLTITEAGETDHGAAVVWGIWHPYDPKFAKNTEGYIIVSCDPGYRWAHAESAGDPWLVVGDHLKIVRVSNHVGGMPDDDLTVTITFSAVAAGQAADGPVLKPVRRPFHKANWR